MSHIIVHLDPRLRDAVKNWADAEDRSVSAQVRKLIREHLPKEHLEATFAPEDDQ